MALNREELKILKHIIANNGDGQLTSKKQRRACVNLFHKGFLSRRAGDWSWVWTGLDYK
jgi:hypothetical protein